MSDENMITVYVKYTVIIFVYLLLFECTFYISVSAFSGSIQSDTSRLAEHLRSSHCDRTFSVPREDLMGMSAWLYCGSALSAAGEEEEEEEPDRGRGRKTPQVVLRLSV